MQGPFNERTEFIVRASDVTNSRPGVRPRARDYWRLARAADALQEDGYIREDGERDSKGRLLDYTHIKLVSMCAYNPNKGLIRIHFFPEVFDYFPGAQRPAA